MPRLLIGNDFNEEMLPNQDGVSWWAQRLAWFAQDGDILVYTAAPDEEYLDYVTSLTRTDRSSLAVVVPPPGHSGTELLTSDRLGNEVLLDELRTAIAGRGIDEVFALWPGADIATLADVLGLRFPGSGFIGQGGGSIVNSKVFFRALASGVGAPLPDGAVCASRLQAEAVVTRLLSAGHPVIVKQPFRSGGWGNRIISPFEGVTPVGAKDLTVVSDPADAGPWLADLWAELTSEGRDSLVVERYHPDSRGYFVEFLITDDGIEYGGTGEMLYAPTVDAQIVPPPTLAPEILDEIVRGGRLICGPLRAMGYRGHLCADAIVTPDGAVAFSEYNGRVTGSTHVYDVIGKQVVGQDYAKDRIIYEQRWPDGWHVSSVNDAADRIARAGLEYNAQTRTGVILGGSFDARRNATMLHIVVATLEDAKTVLSHLESFFVLEPEPAQ